MTNRRRTNRRRKKPTLLTTKSCPRIANALANHSRKDIKTVKESEKSAEEQKEFILACIRSTHRLVRYRLLGQQSRCVLFVVVVRVLLVYINTLSLLGSTLIR